MKKDFGLILVILVVGVAIGLVIGMIVGVRVSEKNFGVQIPNPFVSLGTDSLRMEISYDEEPEELDKELQDKIYDVGDAFYQYLLRAVDKFRRDGDDTDLLILKARINGDKQTEYRLMMRDKWLKDMVTPRLSKGD